MILADTSIWVDYFRSGGPRLRAYLGCGEIVIHQFVIAELALGALRERRKTLAMLDALPQVPVAQNRELRHLIDVRGLYSKGLGFVDLHLIASVLMSSSTLLWTIDKPLRKVAEALGIHVAGL